MHAPASPAPLRATRPARPLVVGHRGASAYRPEHTRASFELAIDLGADMIEPDVVVSRDGALVVRHENELSRSTDVASRPEFAARWTSRVVAGRERAGWFAEDFTLAELRTLRAKERLPSLRPGNARYDGLYQVPTFDEIVSLVKAKEAERGHRVGLYPELKHPAFLLEQGIDSVDLLVAALRKHGLDGAAAPLFVQSFEVGVLQRLDRLIDARLVQLIAADGGPADEPGMSYAEMRTPSGLARVAEYADAIGLDLEYSHPYNNRGLLRIATGDPEKAIADFDAAAHVRRTQGNNFSDFQTPVRLVFVSVKTQAEFADGRRRKRRVAENAQMRGVQFADHQIHQAARFVQISRVFDKRLVSGVNRVPIRAVKFTVVKMIAHITPALLENLHLFVGKIDVHVHRQSERANLAAVEIDYLDAPRFEIINLF